MHPRSRPQFGDCRRLVCRGQRTMETTRQPRKTRHRIQPKRGEIYLAALDPTVGHEIKKARPALVIQNDTSNAYDTTTIVVPITSTVRLPLSPVHVLVPAAASTG